MDIGTARHAFVTGGASGMGLAIGEALAGRGVAVTLADIDEAGLGMVVTARGAGYFGARLDVRDRDQWQLVKAQAEARFGPVDILVNNAGLGPDDLELADTDPLSFERLMAVDVIGVFNGIWAFGGDMRARGSGHIVNNASSVGLSGGVAGLGPYAAAKAGVVAMTEMLRLEMAPHGVGVSVLCPGPVATNFANSTAREGGNASDKWALIDKLDVATVARCVLRGIAQDEPYILTHPEYLAVFDARSKEIRQAFLRQAELA